MSSGVRRAAGCLARRCRGGGGGGGSYACTMSKQSGMPGAGAREFLLGLEPASPLSPQCPMGYSRGAAARLSSSCNGDGGTEEDTSSSVGNVKEDPAEKEQARAAVTDMKLSPLHETKATTPVEEDSSSNGGNFRSSAPHGPAPGEGHETRVSRA